MGKSEKGAVFLDPSLFSPYDFFQYWRNVNDADVLKFMKLFTFLPLEEISSYDNPHVNISEAKERLAYEQTKIIHGQQEADKALEAARALFGASLSASARESVPSALLSASTLSEGIGVLELFAMTDLCKTNSEARRLVEQGGASINDRKITDIKQLIDDSWLDEDGELLLKAGKKRYFRITVQ